MDPRKTLVRALLACTLIALPTAATEPAGPFGLQARWIDLPDGTSIAIDEEGRLR